MFSGPASGCKILVKSIEEGFVSEALTSCNLQFNLPLLLVIVLHYPLQLDWEGKVYNCHGSFSLVNFQGMSLSCILHCYLCCGLLSPFWVCGSTYKKTLQLCNVNCCTLRRLWSLLLCGKDLALLIQIWCRRLWSLPMHFQFFVRTCKTINSIQREH